jgi:hypothetical protein
VIARNVGLPNKFEEVIIMEKIINNINNIFINILKYLTEV